ncbi:unnamed protein product [Meloidogyne enterolobii]|uniref:Uncharacterized protein n=1 Tax=Meloidogyne enterolobii TaxID=390850 RepID=A0ACB1AA25_MELEN
MPYSAKNNAKTSWRPNLFLFPIFSLPGSDWDFLVPVWEIFRPESTLPLSFLPQVFPPNLTLQRQSNQHFLLLFELPFPSFESFMYLIL